MVDGARRHARALAAAALAVVVASAVAVLALPRGHARVLAATQPIAAKALFVPAQHLFGDTPLAEVRVLVNRGIVDPDSVRVGASFAPYKIVGPAVLLRQDLRGGTRLDYRFRIRCLTQECLPKPRKDFSFPPARLGWVESGVARTESVPWPPLAAVSRIRKSDLSQRQFADESSNLPAVTYRIDPDVLAWLLLTLALVLVLGTGTYAAYRLRGPAPARPVVRARPASSLSPLEQALALVGRALAGLGADEQRKALERLGRELGACGRPDLAAEARRLAWSRTGPSVSEASGLCDDVSRQLLGGRAQEATVPEAPAEHALAGRR